MSEPTYTVLSELTKVEDFLDDPVFTDVTGNGEIYTRYRVTRITHEISGHPREWTHMANVAPERSIGIGVALLRILYRAIDDSEVTLSELSE